MRVLLDSCVSGGVKNFLAEAGHDVITIPELGPDPGDEMVLETALQDGRVLVTIDKDFGELAVVRGLPHCGILRLADCSSAQQGQACLQAIARYSGELEAGSIVTVEPGRVRIRPGTNPN